MMKKKKKKIETITKKKKNVYHSNKKLKTKNQTLTLMHIYVGSKTMGCKNKIKGMVRSMING